MVMVMKLLTPYFLQETMQDSVTLISKSCTFCSQGIKSLGTSTAFVSHSAHRGCQAHDLSLLRILTAHICQDHSSAPITNYFKCINFYSTTKLPYAPWRQSRCCYTFSGFPRGWYRPVNFLPSDPPHPPASLFSAPGLSGALGHWILWSLISLFLLPCWEKLRICPASVQLSFLFQAISRLQPFTLFRTRDIGNVDSQETAEALGAPSPLRALISQGLVI